MFHSALSDRFFSKKPSLQEETPAEPLSPLAVVFNRTAAEANKAFPSKLHNLVLLMTTMEIPLYIAPAVAARLSKDIAKVKAAVKRENSYFDSDRNANVLGFADDSCPFAGALVKLVSLNGKMSEILSKTYTKEMRSILTLDHELGHLVVKGGTTRGHMGECAADAFAVLRLVQRFGMETDYFAHSSRASLIVLGLSPIHYTDKVSQKIHQLAQTGDITGLSLTETAALAGDIAREGCLSAATLNKITDAYRPVAASSQKRYGSPFNIIEKLLEEDHEALNFYCRQTLSVLNKHPHDADIFEAGKSFLNHPSRKRFMTDMAKTEPYWQAALDFIADPANENTILSASPQTKTVFKKNAPHGRR
jgi:hypothetical protein